MYKEIYYILQHNIRDVFKMIQGGLEMIIINIVLNVFRPKNKHNKCYRMVFKKYFCCFSTSVLTS